MGQEFLKQVAEKDVMELGRHQNPTNVVGISNSDGYLFNARGLDFQGDVNLIKGLQAADIARVQQGLRRDVFKNWIESRPHFKPYNNGLSDLIDLVKSYGLSNSVTFVDLTASDLTDFHREVIESGESLVTANKIPISIYGFDVFRQLTEFREKYGYSCSVMAGADAVPFLRRAYDNSDPVLGIEGCFSGTLGALCSELQNGNKFSEVVARLKANGDTEPHPRDDLSGLDVAKKLVILARTAGFDVSLNDVKIDPFIPQEYLKIDDVNDFLEKIKQLDEDIEKKFAAVREKSRSLKYVAEMKLVEGKPRLTVGLKDVRRDSSLGGLTGTANKVTIITDIYKNLPYSVEAPGSGVAVTAGNIRGDLLKVLRFRQM